MAGLPDLLAWLDNKRRVAGRNLSDLIQNPAAVVDQWDDQANGYNRNTEPVIQGGQLSNRPMTEDQIRQKYTDLALNAPMGAMTAWHGSPHKFDKFSLDKIGTGEGAQAYGHGLYLAEHPDVAGQYAATLSTQAQKALAGKSGIEKALRKYEDMLTWPDSKLPIKRESVQMQVNSYRKELDDFLAKAPDMAQPQLYKTDIPDEAVARFLDWDKPLSQQSPEVYDAIRQMYMERKITVPSSGPVGSMVHDLGMNLGASGDASKYLASKGIPGIRYLDGGSRSSGQGSSNFVAFDPEMIRILERNGQATGAKPWAPGEYRLKDLIGKE